MSYQIKKISKGTIEILVEIPSEKMDEFNNSALSELAKDVEIPGFRKGKAPLNMVKDKIDKNKVLEKAANLAIQKEYAEIMLKENLAPADYPKVEIKKLALGNPFIFKVIVPLIPKVKLGDYKKIKVKRKEIKIDEKEVNNLLKQLQEMRAKETMVQRPAKYGDKIVVDLEMFLDNVLLENGQAKNATFIIGKKSYIPGFSENLVGLVSGAVKNFSLEYPKDHYDKRLAGKVVNFKIKVNGVYQIDLPKLDDEFAATVGNFKKLEDLKNQLRKNLEEEKKIKEEEKIEIELLKKLINISKFDEIPDILIEREVNKMINELKESIEQQGAKFDDYLVSIKRTQDDLKEEFKGRAEERIKTVLAIGELAKKENIKVEESEINQELEKYLEIYKNKPEIIKQLKTESGKYYVKSVILNRKVITWLKEQNEK
ncbi:trigger factor [bacterium]|nr:trigger factor [bacterium]